MNLGAETVLFELVRFNSTSQAASALGAALLLTE